MSFDAMSWALKQDDVFGNEKWVLFMLAYRDNHEEPHGCYPSMRKIAKDCGIDKMTVFRAIDGLIEKGKISEQKRKRPNGAPTSSYYNFPQLYAPRIHTVCDTHTEAVRAAHTKPKARLTVIERKPRAQSRSARNRFDDEMEQRRKMEAKAKRERQEAEVRMELNVGSYRG